MKKHIILIIPIIIWFFYSGIFFVGKPNKRSIDVNYFKNLAHSILNGRFDIDCPGSGCVDLVIYNGKYYLYWPWMPAVVYIPIVAVLGTNTPDILISSIFGALNVFLIIIFIKNFSDKFNMSIRGSEIVLLSFFWALGTVHFYMSMVGSVWFISQIMAQTFLLLSFISLLKWQSIFGFFISGLFFSIAVYTKNDLLFAIFFITGLLYIIYKNNKKEITKKIIAFCMPVLIFTIINFSYNYIRFNNIFENGIKYHNMHKYFKTNYEKYDYLSVVYISYNFLREVILPPPIKKDYPFFKYEEEGFGFLWNSPLFILSFPVFFIFFKGLKNIFNKKKFKYNLNKDDITILFASFLSLVFISLLIFSIMGAGWRQFASRYSLDYQIFIFIFLLYAFKLFREKKWFYPVAIILGLISFYMNINGVHYFFGGGQI